MLQEAVDALFDNGRRTRAVRGQGNRPLKSLSRHAQGQAGPLPPEPARQARRLLRPLGDRGRARSSGCNQCGLPQEHGARAVQAVHHPQARGRGCVQTVKSAKKLVERERPEVWDILGEIIKDHPVLLNRAPTLHRLGIQALRAGAGRGQGDPHPPAGLHGLQRRLRRRPDGRARAALVRGADRDQRCSCCRPNNILLPAQRPAGRHAEPGHRARLLLPDQAAARAPGARGKRAFAGADEVRSALRPRARSICTPRSSVLPATGQIGRSRPRSGRVLFNEVLPPELRLRQQDPRQEAARGAGRRLLPHARQRRSPRASSTAEGARLRLRHRAGITVGIDDLHHPAGEAGDHREGQKEVDEINRAATATRLITDERALQQGHRDLDRASPTRSRRSPSTGCAAATGRASTRSS